MIEVSIHMHTMLFERVARVVFAVCAACAACAICAVKQAVGTRGGHGWGHLHSGVAMGHLSESTSPSEVCGIR